MSYKYAFDPIAIAEYKEAVEWYGEHSAMAVDKFIAEVERKIIDICSAPTSYRNTYKKYREISLKKFPYSVVYLWDEKTKVIIITSVFHHKRNPKRKYRK